jgi:hypothetical protein
MTRLRSAAAAAIALAFVLAGSVVGTQANVDAVKRDLAPVES